MNKSITSIILTILIVLGTTAQDLSAKERKLIVVGEAFPPYEFIDTEGKTVGIDVDVLAYIFNKMGISYEIMIVPWARAWYMIEHGTADAVLSTSRRPEREPFLIYPEEDMWKSDYVFFTRKAEMLLNFNGYEDAKKYHLKIGITRGNSYHDTFWKAFPYLDSDKRILNLQLEEAVNLEMNMRKLSALRIDMVITDHTMGLYQLKLMNLQDKITNYDAVMFSKGYTMPFARKSTYPDLPIIAKRFYQEFSTMKKGPYYVAIKEKWLGKIPKSK